MLLGAGYAWFHSASKLGGSSKSGDRDENTELVADGAPLRVVKSNAIDRLPPLAPNRSSVLTAQIGVPEGRALDIIARLKASAEAGDPAASYSIYLKLRQCKSAVSSLPGKEALEAYRRAGVSEEAVLSQVSQTLSDCSGLPDSEFHDQRRWIEQAANKGLLEAQLAYATDSSLAFRASDGAETGGDGSDEYKANALRYLNAAAQKGSLEAVLMLAQAYGDGILVKTDHAKAYAYYKAADLARPGLVSSAVLSAQRNKVPGGQVGAAEAAAAGIYRNCCR